MESLPELTTASPDADVGMTWDEAQRLKRRGAYYNKVNIEEIREWKQACYTDHGPCCSDDHRNDLQEHLSNLLLIDTHQYCIVKADTSTKYIALSYVWGGVCTVRSTLATLEQYMKPLALQGVALPHTIRDAMAWTAALGERYIWVVCLCVIQDIDSNAMNHVLKAMGHIYATAELTIVAANGDHANFGLPSFGQLSETDLEGPIKDAEPDRTYHDWPIHSTWDSRGWTFQEALYSRRLLVFCLEYRIMWLCAQTACHGLDHPPWNIGKPKYVGWYRSTNLPMCIKSFPSDLLPLEDWAGAVDNYTKRHLSFEEDFGRAFAGAQYGLGPRFPGDMVHGLPQFFFDICLLWLPTLEISVRRTNYLSWSWTGWTGNSRCKTSWAPYLYFKDIFGRSGQDHTRPKAIVRLTAKAKYTLEGCDFGADYWLNGFYRYQEYRYEEHMEPPEDWQRHDKGKDQFFTWSEDKSHNKEYPWPLPDQTLHSGTSCEVNFTALRCETQVATLDLVYLKEEYPVRLRFKGDFVGAVIPQSNEYV